MNSQKIKAGNVSDHKRVSSARGRIFSPKTAVRHYRPRCSGGSIIKSVAPGTKPGPQWCPTGLTPTQKRRVQRLRVLEIKGKIAEKKHDKWFNQDGPVVPLKMIWRKRRVMIEENINLNYKVAGGNSE
jgi:hypothetical protein